MKIRIKENAANTSYWYHDRVGEVIEAEEIDLDGDYTISNGRYVRYGHAEEVIEHNSQLYRKVDRPVREGDTVLITRFESEEVNVIRTVTEVVEDYPGDFHFTPLYDGEYYFDSSDEECEVLEPIEQPVQPSAPSYAEVSEILHEAKRKSNWAIIPRGDDVITHNGKQYRKVKRKAAVGELVVITDGVSSSIYQNGDIFTVSTLQEETNNVVEGIYIVEGGWFVYTSEYETLEPIESTPTLTETDLIANLAQEVAELKRQLTDAQSDIADLENRLDENEKDTEEIIGRMNDLGDGAEAEEKSIADRVRETGVLETLSVYSLHKLRRELEEALRNG